MPLSGLKFAGCTVKNFNTNLGWGNQKSTVKVTVVEDTDSGDLFVPATIGTPATATYNSFSFRGILQNWREDNSADGLSVYSLVLEDPRDIIEGTALILNSYNGSVGGTPNLLNPYGWWEVYGGTFGDSAVNEGGMPWYKIVAAINQMMVGNGSVFGGPLSYKNTTYLIDLSGMPLIPNYYRIPGHEIDLLRAITTVCNDANHDFFFDIQPATNIIRVRTHSRQTAITPGALTTFVLNATTAGNCVRSSVGLEARNEVTSAFITGGHQTTIYESDEYYQYFGKDVDGVAIIGTKDDPDDPWTLHALLNSSPVADIISNNSYDCTIKEMLAALTGEDHWNNYIQANRPAMASIFSGATTTLASQPGGAPSVPGLPSDAVNTSTTNVTQQCQQIYNTNLTLWNRRRFYNFISQQVREYLGRKFLVEIPFMLRKEESETGRIIYSHKPTSSGYVEGDPPINPPLNLNPIYADTFMEVDGRYHCYCRYPFSGTDLSEVNNEGYVVDSGGIFVQCNLDDEIIFLDDITPVVIVTTNQTPRQTPLAAYGPSVARVAETYLGSASTTNQDFIRDIMRRSAGGTLDYRLMQLPAGPAKFAIPIESTVLTYGPWYAVGDDGKVQYRNDASLVPWNYGGTTILDLTASAMVTDAISFQLYNEMGEVEIVEAPTVNLGDALLTTGPICTGLDIGYSDKGAVSNYRFQTFSQKFGLFAKTNAERIARIARSAQEISRQVRQNIVENNGIGRIIRDRIAFNHMLPLQELGVRNARRSSLPIISGISIDRFGDPSKKRTECSLTNLLEAPSNWMADVDEDYQMVGSMSLSGLFRPISTEMRDVTTIIDELPQMGCYQEVAGSYTFAMTVNSASINSIDPFKNGNDIEMLIKGETYEDAHNVLGGATGQNTQRPIVLRTPMVLTGWGYSVDDGWVPNQDMETLTESILPNYMQKSHLWKTGPLEVLWDDHRCVWTSFGMMIGKLLSECGANDGSAEVELYEALGSKITGRRKNRTVYNLMSKSVPSGSRVICAWVPEAMVWYIIAADCP
jgi:hypothetical protein